MINKITILLLILLFPSIALSERVYLYQWDDGLGQNMSGWTWQPEGNDIIYGGQNGWTLNEDGPLGGGENFTWGYGPRSSDFDSSATTATDATTINTDRAPSTSSGGCMHFWESSVGDEDHGITSWWMWYDGRKLSERTVASSTTDRMSMYVKTAGHNSPTNGSDPGDIMHIGTYLCEQTSGCSGCPYEGPGNQHYYHYTYHPAGIWMHLILDRHPTYLRDSFCPGNDPSYNWPPTDTCGTVRPMHYFETMHQFYIEQLTSSEELVNVFVDEIYFYSTSDTSEELEPLQNDESITNLTVGYDDSTGKWYIGWQDMSFSDSNGWNLNDDTTSTFEIRWSTSPITNDNYSSANVVTPEWFSGPTVTSYPNGMRRQSSWWVRAWTQFDLPDGTETSYNHLYFAVKDVSDSSGNEGTSWPYNKPDGHDAASPYIKTIDYYISPDSASGPTRSNPQPVGEQPAGTTEVTLSITTDVDATCTYGNDGETGGTYPLANSMTEGTNNVHTAQITGLVNGGSYSRDVKCMDDSTSEANDTDFIISWSVANDAPTGCENCGYLDGPQHVSLDGGGRVDLN